MPHTEKTPPKAKPAAKATQKKDFGRVPFPRNLLALDSVSRTTRFSMKVSSPRRDFPLARPRSSRGLSARGSQSLPDWRLLVPTAFPTGTKKQAKKNDD